MSRHLKVLLGLVVASVAGTTAQAQQPHHGGMGEMAGGMTCRGRDAATTAQLSVIHELVMNHDRISRTVTNLPNGVSTVTESDDPRLAGLIRDHVVSMEQRVRKGDDPGLPMESPALRSIFRDRNKIRTGMEPTVRGIAMVQTSSDPAVAAALQQHAAEVSDMAARGMPAMRDAMMKHGGGMLEPGMCAEMRRLPAGAPQQR
jgi:hypothetical protein